MSSFFRLNTMKVKALIILKHYRHEMDVFDLDFFEMLATSSVVHNNDFKMYLESDYRHDAIRKNLLT